MPSPWSQHIWTGSWKGRQWRGYDTWWFQTLPPFCTIKSTAIQRDFLRARAGAVSQRGHTRFREGFDLEQFAQQIEKGCPKGAFLHPDRMKFRKPSWRKRGHVSRPRGMQCGRMGGGAKGTAHLLPSAGQAQPHLATFPLSSLRSWPGRSLRGGCVWEASHLFIFFFGL